MRRNGDVAPFLLYKGPTPKSVAEKKAATALTLKHKHTFEGDDFDNLVRKFNTDKDDMKKTRKLKKMSLATAAALLVGCSAQTDNYDSLEAYPPRTGSLCEMSYTPEETRFALWAPTAESVVVSLYDSGDEGEMVLRIRMQKDDEGTWHATAEGDKAGLFYTFNVNIGGQWLGETPGINAHAVGVNGNRGAIIDMATTDPEGWADDMRPELRSASDAVIYEMHHRDLSIAASSGIEHKGKFLALTEEGTQSPDGLATGLDHLKELGVTHIHLLPSFDYASVDEAQPNVPQFNWGYDPKNYNVPEGSYSTDAARPEVRIREFKQMVQALHKAGLRVVLDVVYNHTFDLAGSNFERTVPGYFYRHDAEGRYSDASGCSNETASERPMMRRYMIESVLYWANEYHIDGFRFDLMGIHDIATMNEIRKALDTVDPSIIIYGEGWAAQAPQLSSDKLAMKANTHLMPGIAAFSDELRDALRGPFSDDHKSAFLSGEGGHEESIRFGIVGGVQHPQVDSTKVNYSDKPWTAAPSQMISYVSCHDDMCLVDRLQASIPNISRDELVRLDKLAQTTVFVSQGIPFLLAGEEMLRTKHGVHNSYCSPDSINEIDWTLKKTNHDTFEYYKQLIALRRSHPAFRLTTADEVREHLEFQPVDGESLVAFRLRDNAGGDEWNEIVVALNSRKEESTIDVESGDYTVVCNGGHIDLQGLAKFENGSTKLTVAPQSALIAWR